MPARTARNATARYMDPLLMNCNPVNSATRFATVLFPLPAGPSIATIGCW
jgi:hypothetical protein